MVKQPQGAATIGHWVSPAPPKSKLAMKDLMVLPADVSDVW